MECFVRRVCEIAVAFEGRGGGFGIEPPIPRGLEPAPFQAVTLRGGRNRDDYSIFLGRYSHGCFNGFKKAAEVVCWQGGGSKCLSIART